LLKIKALASFDRDGVSFRSKALSNNKLPSLINDYFDLIIPNFDYSKVEKVGILTSSVKDKNFDTNLYVDLIENKIISKINKNVKVEHASLPSVIIAHTGPNYTALVLLVKSKKN
jgi:fatty acid-binding protein DegV